MNFRKHGYVYLYAFFADSEGRMNMSQLMFYVSEYNPFMDKVQRNPEPAPGLVLEREGKQHENPLAPC